MVQSLLVRGVGLLKVIHHQMTVSQAAPSFSAGWIQLQDILKILDGLGELLLSAEDARDGVHGRNGPLIVTQSLLIRIHSAIEIPHKLSQTAYKMRPIVSI